MYKVLLAGGREQKRRYKRNYYGFWYRRGSSIKIDQIRIFDEPILGINMGCKWDR